jgi:hypothetical protein
MLERSCSRHQFCMRSIAVFIAAAAAAQIAAGQQGMRVLDEQRSESSNCCSNSKIAVAVILLSGCGSPGITPRAPKHSAVAGCMHNSPLSSKY